ncbi:hypothetical protein IIA29_08755 [candidate division KSB1 bacterium]|nr:hypothetical protein [candidate division KSB1 bacterium]
MFLYARASPFFPTDKRGAGRSQGDFDSATYKDFIHDAQAGVRYLRNRSDIVPDLIGLFGCSEGGWLTPEIATISGNIAFIINRFGPPLSWEETNLFEIENELLAASFSENDIKEILGLRVRIWRYYVLAAADSLFAISSERELINSALADLAKKLAPKEFPLPETLPDFDIRYYARLASNVSYDRTPFLASLNVPTLALWRQRC